MMFNRTQSEVRASVRAFTLVEVAIALGIIGFALVAIIGILPAGLTVQKENREETIINQESSIWMDAIRSGAFGMDYLTNYVDLIEVTVDEYDSAGAFVASYPPSLFTYASPDPDYALSSGALIVGLASMPQFQPIPESGGSYYSNHVVIYTRAISGSAVEKAPQDNQTVREGAFAYRLTSKVVPFHASDDRWFDYAGFRQATAGGAAAGDPSLVLARTVANNMHDVRLSFQWPLRPPLDTTLIPAVATNVGSAKQVFRTIISGSTWVTNIGNQALFFNQPRTYDAARQRGGSGP